MTMPPQETTALLNDSAITPGFSHQEHLAVATSPAVDEDESEQPHHGHRPRRQRYQQHVNNAFAKSFATVRATFEEQRQSRRLRSVLVGAVVLAATVWGTIVLLRQTVDGIRKLLPPSKAANGTHRPASTTNLTGPYKLVERQVGASLFQYYDFLDGADSLGSAGFNVYVGADRAKETDLARVEVDDEDGEEYVILSSSEGDKSTGFMRESIRLEGKRRWNRGLFIVDVKWMPSGCGVWPAFWLTDEDDWPNHGEIDVVEGVNEQSVAKTALHTRESCSMYAHVPPYASTGYWDSATGIPNTWTGQPDLNTSVPADNCWVLAPHQWANQGCVAISSEPDTIGRPFNVRGGGVYVLEWDPANQYMKSWVFPADEGIPENLEAAIDSASREPTSESAFDDVVRPDPSSWEKLPYAYFAIGETTGCSADHFQNHRLIFNLAFCGAVSGNRFLSDCPELSRKFLVMDKQGNPDPVATCNAYIASNPTELKEAYWKVRGVYVYQRA
jgi:Glycosyl hydrolases family 16